MLVQIIEISMVQMYSVVITVKQISIFYLPSFPAVMASAISSVLSISANSSASSGLRPLEKWKSNNYFMHCRLDKNWTEILKSDM